MLEREDNLKLTKFGWATKSEHMPSRKDLMWLKMPEEHVYHFDGDGWYRLDPPEKSFIPIRGITELPHG